MYCTVMTYRTVITGRVRNGTYFYAPNTNFSSGSLFSKMLGKGDSSRISIAVAHEGTCFEIIRFLYRDAEHAALLTVPTCAFLSFGPAPVGFRRRGDPSRTQLRNSANELYRNRFGEGKRTVPFRSA